MPRRGHAQQLGTPVIGYLYAGSPEAGAQALESFRGGLRELGYVEGRNLAIEYRFARNRLDRLPELMADLVGRRVAVVATLGSDAAAHAAKAGTASIPVVFEMGGDPVQSGLVASLNRPGGNLSGITSMNAELSAKRLGLLHEIVPQARRVAALVNLGSPTAEPITRALQVAASRIGVEVEFFSAGSIGELDQAFASLIEKRAGACLVGAGPPFSESGAELVSLAEHHVLPTIYPGRVFTAAGGLMSYATNANDGFRQAGLYTGRILKGEKPAELPVMQPTKFEFIINLKTAKALGLTIPAGLLAIVDEVIE